MRLLSLLLSISIMAIICSCEQTVYDEFKGAKMNLVPWEHGKTYSFDFQIEEPGAHEIILGLRHHAGFDISTVKLKLQLEKPDGSSEEKLVTMTVRDSKTGEFVGKVSGDVGDVKDIAFAKIELEKGIYKVIVEQKETKKEGQKLVGLFGVRLIVDKVAS